MKLVKLFEQFVKENLLDTRYSAGLAIVYDGKVYGAYAKDSFRELTIDSITPHKPRYNKRNMGQSGIATDNCGHVFFGSDSGRIKAYFFNGSKFTFLKNIQVFPAFSL